MIKALATLITITAAMMTAVAAMHRGGTLLEQLLLVTMSVTIVLAVHFLPAISNRKSAWAIWIGCLICAIYGHLTFLTHASIEAAEVRSQQSALVQGTKQQIETVREALQAIEARPIATVAAELAVTDDYRMRAALREEIAQGRRAETLRADLVRLSAVSTEAEVTNATDPVTSRIASVAGVAETTVTVIIGMFFSILLELAGTFLWAEALRRKNAVTTSVTGVTTAVTEELVDTITTVREAVLAGNCRPTVASIRRFVGCSQERAQELRRNLRGESK